MSTRERNLLILLVAMAFVAVNFLGYKMWYAPKMAKLKAAQETAESQAKLNEGMGGVLEMRQADLDFLNRFEPKPTTLGKMKTRIQQLAENEARRKTLTIVGRPKYGPDLVDSSLYYHRARYEMKVNGTETAIYQWLDRLHNPNEFRVVTYMRLEPQRDDLKRAVCEIYLDQWFVPEGGQS